MLIASPPLEPTSSCRLPALTSPVNGWVGQGPGHTMKTEIGTIGLTGPGMFTMRSTGPANTNLISSSPMTRVQLCSVAATKPLRLGKTPTHTVSVVRRMGFQPNTTLPLQQTTRRRHPHGQVRGDWKRRRRVWSPGKKISFVE